jgi:cytochrome c biogenesis protein CcmG/thiol:disulfide interchange protein DsbE
MTIPDGPEETEGFGRVGYGRFARLSPLILALVMAVVIGYIALNRPEKNQLSRDLIGEPAPAVFLTTSEGATYPLASLQGNVVVLNFWASWCEPCKREMPAFEAVHSQGASDVRIIGINLKNDPNTDDVGALLTSSGVTYPIVKDTGGTTAFHGDIEDEFGATGPYPMTIVISPDGTVSQVIFGELDQADIERAIEKARG